MAVRDDFSAGEVLSAADLNDTFAEKLTYPTGGNDGDLLAKDGTDAEWIAVPEAGLTLITTETFSAVSSVSINGCFTSTYANYRVLIVAGGSTPASILLRLRASGSDNSDNDHVVQRLEANGTTTNISRSTTTSFPVGVVRSASPIGLSDVVIANPQAAESKAILANSMDPEAGAAINLRYGTKNVSTQFDGFSIFPVSGTITGTIRVYGYKD